MPHTSDLRARLDQAIALTADAGSIPLRHFNASLKFVTKADASPVTIADQETEQFIRTRLQALFPQDGIFGEEFGTQGLERDTLWVVDPIDGTRSFIAGVPLFGMLLAMIRGGEPLLGVCRMPALNDVYAAARGLGATRNGTPITASDQTSLKDAMLFINEGEKIYVDEPRIFDRLARAGRLRRLSYDCHPHALLAAGQVDAVVDYDLKPYDFLAMSPIVQEAGGVITDWSGAPLTLESDGRVVSAATAALHAELLEMLN